MTTQERLQGLERQVRELRGQLAQLDQQRTQAMAALLRLEGACGVLKQMAQEEEDTLAAEGL